MLFLITISPQVIADGQPGFGHAALGAGGMFVAMVTGVITGLVMSWFGKFSFFKESSAIPDFVRASFDAMLPVSIVVVFGWVWLFDIAHFDIAATPFSRYSARWATSLKARGASR